MNTKIAYVIATVVPFGFVLLALAFAANLYMRRRREAKVLSLSSKTR